MKNAEDTQQKGKECLEYLEDTDIALNNFGEKKLLSTAMSSYYLLYR